MNTKIYLIDQKNQKTSLKRKNIIYKGVKTVMKFISPFGIKSHWRNILLNTKVICSIFYVCL